MNIQETRIYLRGFVVGLLTNMEFDEQKDLIYSLEYTRGGTDITFKTSYNVGFSEFLEQDCTDIVKSVEPTIQHDELSYPFTEIEKLKKEIELKLIEINELLID